jgi:dTDP-4-dehydrorhamnose 3,5-epimerase
MIFHDTGLGGAFIIGLDPRHDERGFFARVWCQREFEAHGLNPRVVQASISYNRRRGTLRGLHYQAAPYAQARLVRCVQGAIYDVIVDLREGSSSYLHWSGVELTAQNRKAVYVPEGFAHGFQTLEDHAEVFYQFSEDYSPAAEQGVRWDDPAFGIRWPDVSGRVISTRDRTWPPFAPLATPIGPHALHQ